jgi:hypothetical protein
VNAVVPDYSCVDSSPCVALPPIHAFALARGMIPTDLAPNSISLEYALPCSDCDTVNSLLRPGISYDSEGMQAASSLMLSQVARLLQGWRGSIHLRGLQSAVALGWRMLPLQG